jgi:hypothetical protein
MAKSVDSFDAGVYSGMARGIVKRKRDGPWKDFGWGISRKGSLASQFIACIGVSCPSKQSP